MTIDRSERALPTSASETTAAWGAVFALAFGVAGLILAEFFPTGVLTPIARDMGVTAGVAGQAVTATSIMAVIASLLLPFATGRFDRRVVLLGLSALLVSSNLLVSVAPNFTVLMLGRSILGVALGGFWSMASATAMRLVPEKAVPRALSIVYGGSSLACVFAVPMSNYLGNWIGWRNTSLVATALSLFALVFQTFTIPRLPPLGVTRVGTLFRVLGAPRFAMGMLAVSLAFGGHFAGFTFLRPFLENVTAVGPETLSMILLAFGVGNFIGTSLTGRLSTLDPRWVLSGLPVVMALCGVGLLTLGHSTWVTTACITLWGGLIGPVAVLWSAWVVRQVPEHAETGGGIHVAAIQLAAAVGAIGGGVIYDNFGSAGIYLFGVVLWIASALTAAGVLRPRT
jgi:DHA1 family purine ribonucleoside efflux pump-like MFS transporter